MSTSTTRTGFHVARLWLVPAVVFGATFGVFGLRHPGSVRAMLMNPEGLGMVAAVVVCSAIAIWASRFRPRIKPVLPFVATLGVLGAAWYAEVPFERRITQNETLIDEPVAAPTATTTAPAAVRHAAGELRGIDHSASGTVSAIAPANDRPWVLRFENFKVQFTPAPVLYVLDQAGAADPGGTRLGSFEATDGDLLDVALPAGVEPGDGWTVLIWCEKFDTPIANATLRPVRA